MSKKKQEMRTLILKGIITGTSDKQSEEFEAKTEQKSAYIILDAENTAKALDFGLREYESKEDKQKFFILKTSEHITINGKKYRNMGRADLDKPNFSSDEKVCDLAIMGGRASGNDYYRLYNIRGTVVPNEVVDPFAGVEMDVEVNDFDALINADDLLF